MKLKPRSVGMSWGVPKIKRRWNRWAYLGEHLQDRHSEWCWHLLRAGLSMVRIAVNDLDDPLLPDQDRERLLAEYLDGKVKKCRPMSSPIA